MSYLIVGLSHKTAPVEIRESLAFGREDVLGGAATIREAGDFDEWMILSTCNRTEVLAIPREGLPGTEAVVRIRDFLGRIRSLEALELEKYLYAYHGLEAVRHFFRVASSLDSMVVGEPQILGQVKESYALAVQAESLGPRLEPLIQRALTVAKKVRTSTGIARNPVSISQAATDLAERIFGDLGGRSALILGAGEMAVLAARHLRDKGVREMYVTSRAFHRAQETAKRVGGIPITFDRLGEHLPRVDVVIASTAAPHYILMQDDGRRLMKERRGRPIFFIDIAVPRDIDPSLNTFDNLYLYDIDDLQQVVDAGMKERMNEAAAAEALVEEEVARYAAHIRVLDVSPSIVALRNRILSMAVAEMRRHRGRLGPLSGKQEEAVRELVGAVVRKIIHGPTRELKRVGGRSDRGQVVDLIRRMWDLSEDEEEDAASAEGRDRGTP